MSVIFGDYVAGFLGLGRDGSGWSMNPFDVSMQIVFQEVYSRRLHILQPIKKDDGTEVGRGEGNQCSVEFNLLYRVRVSC